MFYTILIFILEFFAEVDELPTERKIMSCKWVIHMLYLGWFEVEKKGVAVI